MDKNYKVSKKNHEGKWWSYGNIKKNQWGNYTLGMKMTTELRNIINNTQDGEWLNFSLFEDQGFKEDEYRKKKSSRGGQGPVDLGDEIPFAPCRI